MIFATATAFGIELPLARRITLDTVAAAGIGDMTSTVEIILNKI